MEYEWDEAKHRRNLAERGFGFDYASEVLEGERIDWPTDARITERSAPVLSAASVRTSFIYDARQHLPDHLGPTSESKGTVAMAITRMTTEQIKARRPKVDRAKLDATTEQDIRRYMIEDGQDPDEEIRDEDIISPWHIRRRLGMSQTEFAKALRIPVATLRNWEQHRVAMDPSTIALMTIVAREPEAALRALRRQAA